MHNLAGAYRAAKWWDKAIAMYERTLELRQVKLGPDHSETIRTLSNLAGTYKDAGQLDEAMSLYKQALELRQAQLGSEHPDTAAAMGHLALVYLDAGRHAEAETHARECLRIRQEKVPDDWRTFYAMSLMGRSLTGQTRFADAEPLLLDAYQGMTERETTSEDRLTETLDAIIELYDAWNRPEEAERWRQQRDIPSTDGASPADAEPPRTEQN